jgi:hypothetical protein
LLQIATAGWCICATVLVCVEGGSESINLGVLLFWVPVVMVSISLVLIGLRHRCEQQNRLHGCNKCLYPGVLGSLFVSGSSVFEFMFMSNSPCTTHYSLVDVYAHACWHVLVGTGIYWVSLFVALVNCDTHADASHEHAKLVTCAWGWIPLYVVYDDDQSTDVEEKTALTNRTSLQGKRRRQPPLHLDMLSISVCRICESRNAR